MYDEVLQGSYKVETSGMIIAEGGKFGYEETTRFSIPFSG